MLSGDHVGNVCGRRRRGIPGFVLAALVAIGTQTPSVAAESVNEATIKERHAQVVKMSQVERDRLQRNLETFQKLSPDKQQHYRQLNADLEENRQSGGQLFSLLQTYSAWLQTLTPGQREALRQETDSVRKLALVQKFKEEQYRRLESISVELPEFDPSVPRQRLSLSTPELNRVMELLVERLPEDDRDRIGRVNRVEQYPEILRRSIRQVENPRNWPSEELQHEILVSLPPPFRNFIARNRKAQREMIVRLLFFSIQNQAYQEAQSRFPKDADLNQVLEELDDKQRTVLEQKPPEVMRNELARRYFARKGDKTLAHLDELRMQLNRAMAELGLEPVKGLFPGDGPLRRPGERGPGFEDRRNGIRPAERPPRDGVRPDPRRDGKNDERRDID